MHHFRKLMHVSVTGIAYGDNAESHHANHGCHVLLVYPFTNVSFIHMTIIVIAEIPEMGKFLLPQCLFSLPFLVIAVFNNSTDFCKKSFVLLILSI